MARNRKRKPNGSAWHRKLDDSWHATIKGRRTRLRSESGQPIRGADNRQQAELAVARLKLNNEPISRDDGLQVTQVVSVYVSHLEIDASQDYFENATRAMNDFCASEISRRYASNLRL